MVTAIEQQSTHLLLLECCFIRTQSFHSVLPSSSCTNVWKCVWVCAAAFLTCSLRFPNAEWVLICAWVLVFISHSLSSLESGCVFKTVNCWIILYWWCAVVSSCLLLVCLQFYSATLCLKRWTLQGNRQEGLCLVPLAHRQPCHSFGEFYRNSWPIDWLTCS